MNSPLSSFRDSLSMIDEHGNRRFIIPAEVRGKFYRLKRKVHFVLLLIFLAIPWIHIHGEQLVHLDIPGRKFQFFGIQLLAHDAPLIFFLLFAFAMGLALMTALFGRVWCGWACPQTVFIEAVYRRIEIWTEGNYIERRQLKSGPLNFEKVRKSGLKWILFLFVSLIFSHSFLAYWTGSRELLHWMMSPPSEHQFYFGLVMAMTALLLFNFGWFREQFCLIVCPYGKFQSVLMDTHSKTVMYDEKRGEPRKGSAHFSETQKGDCVSCNRCVQVCPTGIDIRNGIQMECIGCTACIDACDEIMTKVHKPTGLIRYKALTEEPVQWFRPRVLAYSILLLASVAGLGISLARNTGMRVEILRPKDTPYQVRTTETGQVLVQNHFMIRIENDTHSDIQLQDVSSPTKGLQVILPMNHVIIKDDEKVQIPVFVEADQKEFAHGYFPFELNVTAEDGHPYVIRKTLQMIGPIQ